MYIAGESTVASCTINGGKYESYSKYAVCVGNNIEGDGGNREKAYVTINGGTFISQNTVSVIHIDYLLGNAFIYGGTFSNKKVELKDVLNKTLEDFIKESMTVVENADGTFPVH